MTIKDFQNHLTAAIKVYDKEQVSVLCSNLLLMIAKSKIPLEENFLRSVLIDLRSNRYFDLMLQVAESVIHSTQSYPGIQRQYVQALLDKGHLFAAIKVLQPLLDSLPKSSLDYYEGLGLMGRAFKQLFVTSAHTGEAGNQYLNQSIKTYHGAFELDPSLNLWQGINAVALMYRAHKEGIQIHSFDNLMTSCRSLATTILTKVEERFSGKLTNTWDLAIAGEACLALNRTEEARDWYARYARAGDVDAFALSGTTRQLQEIWQLKAYDDTGILGLLLGALLAKEGGRIDLSAQEVKTYRVPSELEKIHGKQGFTSLQWFETAMDRAFNIGLVENSTGASHGTGFLIDGKALSPKFQNETLFVTNAHVVSQNPNDTGALPPDEAVVRFEIGNRKPARIKSLIRSSNMNQLDYSLFTLQTSVDMKESYRVSKTLPPNDQNQRVYIIGHPGGRRLSFSIKDNLLLAHNQQLLHYRAPTEGGSSGSPVFNENWQLVALHHKGGHLPRIDGTSGSYDANEGISIQSIQKDLEQA